MKQTSQRSLLFRQNVNRTEEEWVNFFDGYRKALIEFDMKKLGETADAESFAAEARRLKGRHLRLLRRRCYSEASQGWTQRAVRQVSKHCFGPRTAFYNDEW